MEGISYEDWMRSKLNKLLLLVREKKRIFFVTILLLVLLAGAIKKVEYYHKDFLIKQILINQYFNDIIRLNFSEAFFLLREAGSEEEFFDALLCICTLSILFPLYVPYFTIASFITPKYNDMIVCEEQKVPLLKKHKVYLVGSLIPRDMLLYKLVINTHNLKIYRLGPRDYFPIQKEIKNFNEIIITEKVNINSYEDCVELIKTLVKLLYPYDYNLILNEEEEFVTEVLSFEDPEKPRKIKYRVKPLFIFKPQFEDYYYVEFHIGEPGGEFVRGKLKWTFVVKGELLKWTFIVKKNGVVCNFNEIYFYKFSYM